MYSDSHRLRFLTFRLGRKIAQIILFILMFVPFVKGTRRFSPRPGWLLLTLGLLKRHIILIGVAIHNVVMLLQSDLKRSLTACVRCHSQAVYLHPSAAHIHIRMKAVRTHSVWSAAHLFFLMAEITGLAISYTAMHAFTALPT